MWGLGFRECSGCRVWVSELETKETQRVLGNLVLSREDGNTLHTGYIGIIFPPRKSSKSSI